MFCINYSKVLFDGITGFLALGLASYLNQIYIETNDIVRVYAFIWAAPVMYFILLNMFDNRQEKDVILEFNKHALLGLVILFLSLAITHNIYLDYSRRTIVLINLAIIAVTMLIYFIFGIYKKGVL